MDPAKVRDYLISSSHPIGRFKAVFFRALGYSDENWETLVVDLKRHAIENDVAKTRETPYGQKLEVRASP